VQNENAVTKCCSICKKKKPATREFFSPQPRGFLGLHSYCRICARAAQRQRYRRDPDAARAKMARWRAENPERERRLRAKQWAANVKRHKSGKSLTLPAFKVCPTCAVKKPLTAEHYSRCSGRKSGFYPTCKVCSRAVLQRWRNKNRAKMRAFDAKHKQKREADIAKRLAHRFGVLIRYSLAVGRKSRCSWQKIVGYTVQDLMRHLERQFLKGMSWDNYGDWHIDHILPVTSFSFTSLDDAEFRACWALPNLRPLWAPENLSKNNKREFLI
jgi:hypothetical protein